MIGSSASAKAGQRAKDGLKNETPTPLTVWRHRLRGWWRQLPDKLLRKASLSELVEAQVHARTEALMRQANYDALTHLPNRHYFTTTLEQSIQQAEQTGKPFALLFLDLDGFKPVNDTYGHGAGDELLRLVAGRLTASVREEDFVARLGGDEFVILLRNGVDDEVIETICKRLIHEVSRPYWVEGVAVQVSTSVGVAEFPADGKTAGLLMEHADQALYVAKHRGRKQFCFYRDVSTLPNVASDQLQARFEVDAEHQKFTPFFRPVVAMNSQAILGVRMNVRWEGAPPGHVWYEDWQTLLARSQWGLSMGLWMVEMAAWQLAQWQEDAWACYVPLDQALLLQEDVATLLVQRVSDHGISPEQLILSVDTDVIHKLDQRAVQVLADLKAAGFCIAVHGFGHKALEPTLFAQLDIDQLIIRWPEVQTLANAEAKRLRWLVGLIQWGHALGADVLVSDVDDDAMLSRLHALGVDAVEGAAVQDYVSGEAMGRYLSACA